MMEQFENAWAGAGPKELQFSEDNPFMTANNPQSSEGWRMLGQLYAEQDQDVEAIQCLRKGHEADPYNLESLLALGVSCTNELDQLPALKYLRTPTIWTACSP